MQSSSLNMQRKPGFPVANCTIKMPDGAGISEAGAYEEDSEQQQRRLQLINFGHTQWGFNNWSWAVTKQELDFVEQTNGKYCAGVVAFVSITVKNFDIHRENIGYATSNANTKGFAIYKSRKCAVTNALRETLLSFGGTVASELLDLSESYRAELAVAPSHVPPVPPDPENNQNAANMPNKMEPKNMKSVVKKEETVAQNMKGIHVVKNNPNPVANAARSPPVARAQPMPCPAPGRAPLPPPPPRAPAPLARPNSNVSFVLQPVMGAVPPMYPPPRPVLPQPLFPNYYEYAGPWHIAAYEPYERGNVNLNFNIPPKNLVVNSRSGSVECKSREGEALQYAAPQGQGCWIKPTIFYDGFWTEQKVKKWVAEQVEKQFPEEGSHKSASPGNPDTSKS